MQIKADEFQARTGIATGGPSDVVNQPPYLAGSDRIGRTGEPYPDTDPEPEEPEG